MSSPREDVRLWRDKADSDVRLAAWALEAPEPIIAGACFHAQQAAEKYLKAVLVAQETRFPPTHDLGTLIALLVPTFPEVEPLRERADALTEYAVEIRYPDALREPRESDARRAIENAQHIRRFCLAALGEEPTTP